ncbi:MAG: glycoside hydrolase family 20 protein [Bacteroidales bacterium]
MKNYLKILTLFLTTTIALFSCNLFAPKIDLNLIPYPSSVKMKHGSFLLNDQTVIHSNLDSANLSHLTLFLKETPLDLPLSKDKPQKNLIYLEKVDSSATYPTSESYGLSINASSITISASSNAGLFYGVQSLLQIIRLNAIKQEIPAIIIRDTPRFPYRGMHLDVSRHFFSKEFIKNQLDAMASYKLNRFHWHLTDGAGWRIEIKKYPLLTENAAWRPYNSWKEWNKDGRKYCSKNDPKAMGGYYTQEDIKEIVAYAQARHITVIPEIEMPGHSEEVLTVYPELSCAEKSYENSDFCVGNEQTFTFLQNVLIEVMELFPSEYIHIGGDEAGKAGWKTCPKCKTRMQTENLKDVDELQSYMIHRIEEFLNANGRKLLGWDEIMEGGLAPSATVMAWRGEEAGIKAARLGHQVIMTPGTHCYFDFAQDDPTFEPECIGGYLPLQKVYNYNPTSDSLTAKQKKLIVGVQANLWTEYIGTPQYAEYMIYPRALALAEVAWTAQNQKSWSDFHRRTLLAVNDLKDRGYNPFSLSNERGNKPESEQTITHLATNKPIQYNEKYSTQYPAGGDNALLNGIRGGWNYSDQLWQGFSGENMDVVIDLETATNISSISAEFMQITGAWVWTPNFVEIEVSDDGVSFTPLARIDNNTAREYNKLAFQNFAWSGSVTTRYVRYVAHIQQKNDFIFTDEIIIL